MHFECILCNFTTLTQKNSEIFERSAVTDIMGIKPALHNDIKRDTSSNSQSKIKQLSEQLTE
jgi:hypothetical protein